MTLPNDAEVAEVVTVPFHDGEVLTVDQGGKPHVILKPAFEAIGLHADSQIRKIRQQPWARTAVTAVRGNDGRVREMATADVRTFLMALATIPVSRVSAEAQPLLAAYQSEVADVIEAYWTKGGAINPRASDDQLDDLTAEIEMKRAERKALFARLDLSVIEALGTSVDPTWRESLARHRIAVYNGTAPEIAPENRMLMAEPYLLSKGISRSDVSSIRAQFGKYLKAAYIKAYGREPEMTLGMVNGREREVKGYYERDRHIFDAVFEQHYAHLTGPAQLELGAA